MEKLPHSLMAPSEPLAVIVVSAAWCPTCPVAKKKAAAIATAAGAACYWVDMDERPELAARYRVAALPGIVIIRGGEHVGTVALPMLAEALQE